MPSFLGFFLSYVLLYKYLALSLIIFSAGVSIPIPINLLLIAVGAFSSQSYLSFKISFIIAIVANVLGDIVSYLIFRKISHTILREKYVNKYSFFIRLENYFKKHTGSTILISRIIGPLGAPVNFLSGFFKIPLRTFAFFDFLGNILFVSIFLSLGFIVGAEWQVISVFVTSIMRFMLVSFLLLLLIILYGKQNL